MKNLKQIIAMGGGGFSMEPDNPLLDDYVLKQSNKSNPKICFTPTASGDSEGYINRFYTASNLHGFAYRYSLEGDKLEEEKLPPIRLGLVE